MEDSPQRRMIRTAGVILGFFLLIGILFYLVAFIVNVLIKFELVNSAPIQIPPPPFLEPVISSYSRPSIEHLYIIPKWWSLSLIVALFVRAGLDPGERDRISELILGLIFGAILLLPIIWILVLYFPVMCMKIYDEVDNPFSRIQYEKQAKLIENQSSRIRSFGLNSAVLSLAAIAFLFSEIDNPGADSAFLPFVFSILFLFASVILSEYTVYYKSLLEYQNICLIYGVFLLFLGILRGVGRFTGWGIETFEMIFLLVLMIWGLGLYERNNVRLIVSREDPRLKSKPTHRK
mgnify:CR=1 FL=1